MDAKIYCRIMASLYDSAMNIFFRLSASLLLIAMLSACADAIPLHRAVPVGKEGNVVVKGYGPNIRSWGDEAPQGLNGIIEKRIREYSTANGDYFKQHKQYPAMEYLAISGGGDNGAFGAGVLCGWTASGKRPQFTIVTGVSTGALIAPFAFLGSEYDDELKEVYTTLSSNNIIQRTLGTVVNGITGGLALANNSPLEHKIDEVITEEMYHRIAEEHRKGRRLLVATTNIEAQRSVIWDLGSIANSGNPGGLKLFRQIMLASAAVPGVVAPVFIDVTADGKKYSEIHADGGVTAQVFLYPLQSTRRESILFRESQIPRHLYIIRNAKITPEYKPIKPGLFSISGRSVETLIKYQGLGDLYRLYVGANRDGIDYNLIYVPSDFALVSQELFDPVYMKAIFERGYLMGKDGVQWMKAPPGVEYIQ